MENPHWNIQTEDQNKIKKTRIWISAIFTGVGLIIIASQVIPLTKSYIDGLIEQTRANSKIEPVPESYKTYIESQLAYYDPGKSYFANLTSQIGVFVTSSEYYDVTTQTEKTIVIDKDYTAPMTINIPSIGISTST
jgi:hypothetical protein